MKHKKRKKAHSTMALALALVCIFGTVFEGLVFADRKNSPLVPQIWVEGSVLTFNAETGVPFVDTKGRTQVPLRKALEIYGARVDWDQKSQSITVHYKSQRLGLKIGQSLLTLEGQESISMDTAPQLKLGKVYLPIYPVIKALGGYVNWRPDLRAVMVTANEAAWPLVTFKLGSESQAAWRGRLVTLRLNPEAAPLTVANFMALAASGFYEGTLLHRIIPGFVVQGGDPTGTGSGGPGTRIKGEFLANGIQNILPHLTGTLSMARGGDYDSAGSQFFICLGNQPALDGQYAAFGEVIEGMDAILSLSTVATDTKDRPIDPVWIEQVTLPKK